MSIKITIPNSSSDVLTFGSGNTPTAAQIAGIDSGSSNGQLALYTTASGTSTERVRVDASGNVGIGTSSPVSLGSGYGTLDIRGSNGGGFRWGNSTNSAYSYADVDGAVIATATAKPIILSTNNTERARIDSSGNLLVGTTSGSNHVLAKDIAVGSVILGITNAAQSTALFYGTDAAGNSTSNTGFIIRKVNATGRSINAAGTINASGADYAEYMTKAGNFVVSKGDVVGINAEGQLTNVFADAVSFCVKSTDPSYVGGDVWGNEEALGLVQPKQPTQRQATEEAEAETDEEFAIRQSQYESDKAIFETALEAARQTVDRIAFAGQVPVNVTGATAGQYIIPINDNGAIKGEAVSNPTFEQYQTAVGKVIAIESDGRAKIIVKVA